MEAYLDSGDAALRMTRRETRGSTKVAGTELATLGGGCFWCVEAIYSDLRGTTSVVPGYAGGTVGDLTYEQVCQGNTGHAEVVQITFDPRSISYPDLLYVFWRTHDPTTLNRQGPDVGSQYRSVIPAHSERQRVAAEDSRKQTDASDLWPSAIVTEIRPYEAFYPAEAYHVDYFRRNPGQPYCRMVIDPKIREFREKFRDRLG